jgi:uncharacterized membrane protein YtjA (UPF0391 family)
MSKLEITLLALALISLVIGLAGHSAPIVDGLGKAMFGVFLILFFILRFFGGQKEA